MAIFQSGVIFDQVDTHNPDCWHLDAYQARGGYQALRKILSEKLYPHLLEIDRAARERMDAMLPRMMEAAGVTGTVVLAESHLAIHTWPETGDVTLDVYVCNFSRDNSDRAQAVYDNIIAALDPSDIVAHRVTRGKILETA